MTSSGALLVALFLFQNPSGAAGAPPEAASTSTKARLELRGAAECVSRSDLTARVASRSPRIQFVDDAEIYAQVMLISSRPGKVVAQLVLATAGVEPAPRRFVARSCAEVADAIALIIAVTLDPTLKKKAAVGPAQDRNAAADGDAGSRATTKAGTAPIAPPAAKPPEPPAPDKQPARPAPPATPESPAPPAPAPAATTRRHFSAHIAGQTIFGPAPAVMPGVGLYGMAALDRAGVWAPALLVGATGVWRGGLSEPGGTASFALYSASLDACPLRLAWSRLVARPCASALIGRLTARGSDTDQRASSVRPFAAAGAAVSASFGATVELSARLGISMTLLRDSYEFGAMTFHRAGLVTVSASLGIGLHWP